MFEKNLRARGVWNREWRSRHINEKELRATIETIRAFESELAGKTILLKTDNRVAMAYINRMTGRIQALADIARELIELVQKIGAKVQATYIGTKENREADELSRWKDTHDWTVKEEVSNMLQKRFGPHTIDRFADRHNTKTKRFNSWRREQGSEGVDAFSMSWKGENNWVVPPIPLLPRVAQKLESKGATATVVTPKWPAQTWYQKLKGLAIEEIEIPRRMIRKNNANWRNSCWSFVVFRISGEKERVHGMNTR